MKMLKRLLGAVLALATGALNAADLPLEQIKLPPGFSIELWSRVDNPRQMALGRHDRSGGTLFVGSMNAGKVHAIRFDASFKAQAPKPIASDLPRPVGVAYKDGRLYVSAISRILRFDAIEQRLDNPPEAVTVTDQLPSETHHGWKFIAFGPDGKLYVPVGAPCNICDPDTERYANILRMDEDGSGREVFARGVRNSVGFDWHPQTKELWFTENGRDLLGDDLPPDELNHAPRAGLHFGYPYCHGGDLADPQFGHRRRSSCRTRHRSACVSIPARCSRPNTATRSSSPSMVRGTVRKRSAIASRWRGCRATRSSPTKLSPAAGCRANAPGDGRPTCWSSRTVPYWWPTIRPTRSIASPTNSRVVNH